MRSSRWTRTVWYPIFSSGSMTAQSAPVPGGAGSAPVLGDLDEDGYIEVIFGGEGRLWVVRFNGVHQTDTPIAFPLKDETGLISATARTCRCQPGRRPGHFRRHEGRPGVRSRR